MNISFECPDKINGLMTVTIEKGDIEKDVEKTLKKYRQKAVMPGFRPGNVPMGLIRRQHELGVKMDAINETVSRGLYDYLHENNINMLGQPMPNVEKQPEVDPKTDGPWTFVFDIAVAPEVTVEIGEADTVDFYDIELPADAVDKQVENIARSNGHAEDAEQCDVAANDLIYAHMVELGEDGKAKEGGVDHENSLIMPSRIKDDTLRKPFEALKVGTTITVEPKKLFADNESELAQMLGIDKEAVANLSDKFELTPTKISHYTAAAVDQNLFDAVFGKDQVTDEETFRSRIADGLKAELTLMGNQKFADDVKKYIMNKVGKLEFPEQLLRRIVEANREDKSQEITDEQMAKDIEALAWDTVKEKLAADNNITVDQNDIKAEAKNYVRQMMASYGLSQMPDNFVEEQAEEYLKKRNVAVTMRMMALENKLVMALKDKVKLNRKAISLDDFNKLGEEK